MPGGLTEFLQVMKLPSSFSFLFKDFWDFGISKDLFDWGYTVNTLTFVRIPIQSMQISVNTFFFSSVKISDLSEITTEWEKTPIKYCFFSFLKVYTRHMLSMSVSIDEN